jgi:YegS/Rv2252/BmrU family lipid kinase
MDFGRIRVPKRKPWFTIINPCSGSGKGKSDWPHIEDLLKKSGIQFHAVHTESRNHAAQLTREAITAGFRRILTIGGDGTINEVINGIFHQQEIPTTDFTIAMIPVGTGNDWRRTIGIPVDYMEAIATIQQEEIFTQDVGYIRYLDQGQPKGRYFINIAGMGYDAFVTAKTNFVKELGRKMGVYAYLVHLFGCLLKYKHTRVKVTADHEEITTDLFSMNVGICKYNGGGMMQVPKAVPDDGLLDLTLIRKMSKLEMIKNVPGLFDGSFIRHPQVLSTRGRKIIVESVPAIPLEVDGESLGSSPFEINIIPRSINVVMNRKYLMA